jgi:SAM-dependent methyltransferase
MVDELPCIGQPTAADEVDEAGYFAANPDAKWSGMTARQHFLARGYGERRSQWINLPEIAGMRERKLARVAFGRAPELTRQTGHAPNFLSKHTIEEFAIPESPPVSAHPYGQPVLELIQGNREKLMLDVGAGLRQVYYANVINTDIYASVSTDVICVAEELPFTDEQFDVVFCLATLEHTRRPWDVAREICRVLKPGGTVMIDYPFMQPVHGYPHHYFNATPLGNRSLFESACDVRSVEIGWHHHPIIAVQWILTVFRNGLQPEQARRFEDLRVGDLVNAPLATLIEESYCRELAPQMKEVIAAGSLLIATKKARNEAKGTPAA